MNSESILKYIYSETDTYTNEIAELYSYSERNELQINLKTFKNQMELYNLQPYWQKLTTNEQKSIIMKLLNQLEMSDKVLRMIAARCIYYIAQGCWSEINSVEEQQKWTKINVMLLYELGTFTSFIDLLYIETKNIRSINTSIADSEDLRIILTVLCIMTEVMRVESLSDDTKYKYLVDNFVYELGLPVKGELLIIKLFEMVTQFCKIKTNFPIKKVLILIWKIILITLGGFNTLRELKNTYRKEAGLCVSFEDNLEVLANICAHAVKDSKILKDENVTLPQDEDCEMLQKFALQNLNDKHNSSNSFLEAPKDVSEFLKNNMEDVPMNIENVSFDKKYFEKTDKITMNNSNFLDNQTEFSPEKNKNPMLPGNTNIVLNEKDLEIKPNLVSNSSSCLDTKIKFSETLKNIKDISLSNMSPDEIWLAKKKEQGFTIRFASFLPTETKYSESERNLPVCDSKNVPSDIKSSSCFEFAEKLVTSPINEMNENNSTTEKTIEYEETLAELAERLLGPLIKNTLPLNLTDKSVTPQQKVVEWIERNICDNNPTNDNATEVVNGCTHSLVKTDCEVSSVEINCEAIGEGQKDDFEKNNLPEMHCAEGSVETNDFDKNILSVKLETEQNKSFDLGENRLLKIDNMKSGLFDSLYFGKNRLKRTKSLEKQGVEKSRSLETRHEKNRCLEMKCKKSRSLDTFDRKNSTARQNGPVETNGLEKRRLLKSSHLSKNRLETVDLEKSCSSEQDASRDFEKSHLSEECKTPKSQDFKENCVVETNLKNNQSFETIDPKKSLEEYEVQPYKARVLNELYLLCTSIKLIETNQLDSLQTCDFKENVNVKKSQFFKTIDKKNSKIESIEKCGVDKDCSLCTGFEQNPVLAQIKENSVLASSQQNSLERQLTVTVKSKIKEAKKHTRKTKSFHTRGLLETEKNSLTKIENLDPSQNNFFETKMYKNKLKSKDLEIFGSLERYVFKKHHLLQIREQEFCQQNNNQNTFKYNPVFRTYSWKPKSSYKDIDRYLRSSRIKYIGFGLQGEVNNLAGLPQPIHEGVTILKKHTYTSLSEIQFEQETKIIYNDIQDDYTLTPTEILYQAMLPNLAEYMVCLTNILIATIKKTNLNISAEIQPKEIPQGVVGKIIHTVDINRHNEIITKVISSILLLLLKHLKINHVCQFELMSYILAIAQVIPVFLKYFEKNIVQHTQTKNVMPLLEFPNYVIRTLHVENLEQGILYSWRNMTCCVNVLRILNKIIKDRGCRITTMVLFKSELILKRILQIKHPIIQFYVLKLLKMQCKYLGKQWRRDNMDIVSAIYAQLRHRIVDDWAFGNEVKTRPINFEIEEEFIKAFVNRFHKRRYDFEGAYVDLKF